MVLLDRRGQGCSDKPHDPAACGGNACARDITAVLDHLGLDRGDLLACSLGAQIGLRVLEVEHRVRRAVLGGIRHAVLDWDEGAAIALAEVLKGDEPTLDKGGRALRARVDRLGRYRFALATLWRGRYVNYDRYLSMVEAAVLVINDLRDLDFGDPAQLAALIPGATTFGRLNSFECTLLVDWLQVAITLQTSPFGSARLPRAFTSPCSTGRKLKPKVGRSKLGPLRKGEVPR